MSTAPSRAQRFGTGMGRPAPAGNATASKPSPEKDSSTLPAPAEAAASPTTSTGSRAAGLGNTWGRPYAPAPTRTQFTASSNAPAASAPTPVAAQPQRRGGLTILSEPDPELISRKPKRAPVQYSDQQNAIIHCPAKIVVVNAFAGTGKTTTAVGYADARPNDAFLYIAFNKGIQEEASTRFGNNVTCRTTHSLAWSAVGHHYGKKNRLARPWRTFTLRNEAAIPDVRDAAIIQSILLAYMHSADEDIGIQHCDEASAEFNPQEHELHDAVASAKRIWARMCDLGDRISVPDDAYLKMWALARPKLPYSHIIFDEAQDSNPVIEQVVRAQKQANILYIGDRHQSIYAFRGSRNAMDGFADNEAKQLHLSQTWRFGPKVARVANLILGELKGETIKIEGMGQDAPFVKGSPVTKLARTNAQLFKEAALCRGEGLHWIGGARNYRLDRIQDAYNLYANRRSDIRDPMLRQFTCWQEMQSYAEEAKDRELKALAEVVDEYRHDTPTLVTDITRNEVADAKDAKVVLTTGHKAKGLDWDYVEICNDFEVLAETEADLAADPHAPIEEQEINLLYVTATRAKKMLHLNDETSEWIRRLPEHRAARELALRKSRRAYQVPA